VWLGHHRHVGIHCVGPGRPSRRSGVARRGSTAASRGVGVSCVDNVPPWSQHDVGHRAGGRCDCISSPTGVCGRVRRVPVHGTTRGRQLAHTTREQMPGQRDFSGSSDAIGGWTTIWTFLTESGPIRELARSLDLRAEVVQLGRPCRIVRPITRTPPCSRTGVALAATSSPATSSHISKMRAPSRPAQTSDDAGRLVQGPSQGCGSGWRTGRPDREPGTVVLQRSGVLAIGVTCNIGSHGVGGGADRTGADEVAHPVRGRRYRWRR
jgi:hypothetical protein